MDEEEEQEQCSFCKSDDSKGNLTQLECKCSAYWHLECIKTWIKSSNNLKCPSCGGNIRTKYELLTKGIGLLKQLTHSVLYFTLMLQIVLMSAYFAWCMFRYMHHNMGWCCFTKDHHPYAPLTSFRIHPLETMTFLALMLISVIPSICVVYIYISLLISVPVVLPGYIVLSLYWRGSKESMTSLSCIFSFNIITTPINFLYEHPICDSDAILFFINTMSLVIFPLCVMDRLLLYTRRRLTDIVL